MTSDRVHRYVVAYDVASDIRRARVAKLLESYGDRIQYSVFLVDAKPAKLLRMEIRAKALLQLSTDSLMICDLGPIAFGNCDRVRFVGTTRPFTGHEPLVF